MNIKRFLTVVLFVILSVFVAAAAFAQTAQDMAKNLPREYSGIFRWDGKPGVQALDVHIKDVQVVDGKVVALGNGEYRAGAQQALIDVKLTIDPKSGELVMQESAPGVENFVENGAHVGAISDDLRIIDATWSTAGSNEKGILRLGSK